MTAREVVEEYSVTTSLSQVCAAITGIGTNTEIKLSCLLVNSSVVLLTPKLNLVVSLRSKVPSAKYASDSVSIFSCLKSNILGAGKPNTI